MIRMAEEEKIDKIHEERSRMSGGEIDKGRYVSIQVTFISKMCNVL